MFLEILTIACRVFNLSSASTAQELDAALNEAANRFAHEHPALTE
jgi:hypothetical protein